MCGSLLPRLQAPRRRRRQSRSLTLAVGFQQAARDQIADRGHAGARELRHVVRSTRTPSHGSHRYRERQRDQRRRGRRPRRSAGAAAPHANRSTSHQTKREQRQHATGDRHLARRARGRCSAGMRTVSASMIMRSTKLALMIRMSCLNCDSRISTTTMTSDSDAATAGRRSSSSKEIEKTPGQQIGERARRACSRSRAAPRAPPDAAHRHAHAGGASGAGGVEQAGRQGGNGGRHDLTRPRPDIVDIPTGRRSTSSNCNQTVVASTIRDTAGGGLTADQEVLSAAA